MFGVLDRIIATYWFDSRHSGSEVTTIRNAMTLDSRRRRGPHKDL